MASKHRNMFYENKKQETTEIGLENTLNFGGDESTRFYRIRAMESVSLQESLKPKSIVYPSFVCSREPAKKNVYTPALRTSADSCIVLIGLRENGRGIDVFTRDAYLQCISGLAKTIPGERISRPPRFQAAPGGYVWYDKEDNRARVISRRRPLEDNFEDKGQNCYTEL
ncbi:hypothetical protein AAG570_003892 [Ranatra chinensis]|uniref:Uncharacterized protein n=1 Tax=Ranatra chinensis TaxID=642074 RepID=A0ABD0Y268_9HEMI